IKPAFHGMDMVLHLSSYTGPDNWEDTMAVTVAGTLNVFRAAQEAGVKRVVFMSTGSTMCGYEWDDDRPYGKLARGDYAGAGERWPLISYCDPPQPESTYGPAHISGDA